MKLAARATENEFNITIVKTKCHLLHCDMTITPAGSLKKHTHRHIHTHTHATHIIIAPCESTFLLWELSKKKKKEKNTKLASIKSLILWSLLLFACEKNLRAQKLKDKYKNNNRFLPYSQVVLHIYRCIAVFLWFCLGFSLRDMLHWMFSIYCEIGSDSLDHFLFHLFLHL